MNEKRRVLILKILKFEKIKNIGQIKDYTATGDVSFKNVNLIYGENAVGKSTLSAIFRALKTGDTTSINLKKTIGILEPVEQYIKLKVNLEQGEEDKTFEYVTGQGQSFETHLIPDIEIFDAYFVEKNILSGWQCSTEQQKNLPNLILGENGILQVLQLEKYKTELTEKIPSAELILKNKIIEQNRLFADLAFKAEEFLQKFYNIPKPSEDYNYDQEIQNIENRIKILQTLANNPEHKPFRLLPVPDFNKDYFVNEILHKTLDSLSSEAERRVKEHAFSFNMPNAAWLVQGNVFLGDKTTCPFCGQSISEVDLIHAYKAYFSEEYKNFNATLKTYDGISVLGESKIAEIANIILLNDTTRKDFNGGIVDEWPTIDVNEFRNVCARLYRVLQTAHEKKKSLVLDSVDLPPEFEPLFAKFCLFVQKIKNYNDAINTTNTKLSELNADDLPKETKNLSDIKMRKARWCELGLLAENEVKPLIEKRSEVTRNNKNLQETFRTNATEFKNKYENSINAFLKDFGVNFRVQITQPNFRTAKPSYDFGVIIDGYTENVISARPRISIDSEQCVGNALSEGDKSTLAFAFFLAKLTQDEMLGKKIIVIDDPISSLGDFRKRKTVFEIQKLSKHVSQLFVLSHDPMFLNNVMKHIRNHPLKTLIISKNDKVGSAIEECNLSEIVKERHLRAYGLVKKYYETSTHNVDEKVNVIAAIRVYLEGLLQSLYPSEFKPEGYLGVYCGIIESNPNHKLRDIKDQLSYLNDFSSPEHHNSLENLPTDAETMKAVRETLNLVDFLLSAPPQKAPIFASTIMDEPLKM